MLDEGVIMEVFSEAIMVALKVAGPLLIISVLVGLLVAIFQAATQIHEQTLTFVPKVVVMALILLAAGPWMLKQITDFVQMIFQVIAVYG